MKIEIDKKINLYLSKKYNKEEKEIAIPILCEYNKKKIIINKDALIVGDVLTQKKENSVFADGKIIKEALIQAVQKRKNTIVLLHNHPKCRVTLPSGSDLEAIKRLNKIIESSSIPIKVLLGVANQKRITLWKGLRPIGRIFIEI